jgi:hypothetical protein
MYGWPSGMHTRQSSTQGDKYQVSHRYSYFSWWWAHSLQKHVEKRNKHTKKIVHQVGFIYKIIQGYTVNKTYCSFRTLREVHGFVIVFNPLLCITSCKFKTAFLLKSVYVFCLILIINSNYFPKQHWPVDVCNGDRLCFLWVRNWIFIYDCIDLRLQINNFLLLCAML